MEILQAYCVELGKVIDINEVQSTYFDGPASNRKRFTFRCSDEECRRLNNPLVPGVSYHHLAEETDKCRQPHFRAATASAEKKLVDLQQKRQRTSLSNALHVPRKLMS